MFEKMNTSICVISGDRRYKTAQIYRSSCKSLTHKSKEMKISCAVTHIYTNLYETPQIENYTLGTSQRNTEATSSKDQVKELHI
jgi:hypothetical protein